jgi:hypothetical protein
VIYDRNSTTFKEVHSKKSYQKKQKQCFFENLQIGSIFTVSMRLHSLSGASGGNSYALYLTFKKLNESGEQIDSTVVSMNIAVGYLKRLFEIEELVESV